MIIVTGASGKLGRAVVEKLLDRVPADQVGVSVRDPEKARGLAKRGARVRHGSFDDPASLAHSFEGATRVLVVSVNSTGPARIAMHRTAIEAARDAGAERVFYTSHAGAAPQSPFPPMPDHYATEEILHDSDVPGTALRGGFYADSAVMFLGDAAESGELAAPEDGPVNWTTHDDMSEAMAAALADPDIDEETLELTGSETVDLAGVAAIAAELSGRPIRRTVVPDGDFRDGMIARGLPPERADMMLGIFRASRQGGFSRLAPTLEQLIGRRPMTMRDVLSATMTG
ncbi:MAG: SDR family oxidoreductase [Solirubrobacteraceae bacterium]